MKKLLILLMLLLPLMANAQDKVSVVKLKNGTQLKGVIKSIDPTDAVVMDIAGVETTLKFDSVLSIESLDINNQTPETNKQFYVDYHGTIKSLQKKIEKGKLSKKLIEDFTIK